MKNIFKREDGTFKIINTTAFVLVIAFLLMLLIIKITFDATPITERHYNTTTTTTTEPTTMKMCNNCNIKFKRSKVTIKSNTEIDLDELLSVSNMSMYQVKFKDYDKDLISINMNSLTIKSLDKIGSTTLVAYYEDVESSIEVIVDQDYINSAKFTSNVQYVHVGETKFLDMELTPVGIDRKYISLFTSDPNIVSIDENGQIRGIATGDAVVSFESGKVKHECLVHVVLNKIEVAVKNDKGVYTESESYDYKSKLDGYLYFSIRFEDINNEGYNVDSLIIDIESHGSISTEGLKYQGTNTADSKAFLYMLPIKVNDADALVPDEGVSEEEKDKNLNYIKINFSLPDGSTAEYTINRVQP